MGTPGDVRGAGICALVVLTVFGWIAVGADAVSGHRDAMEYVLVAEYYRSFFQGGTPEPLVTEYFRLNRFPPLHPMLLGLFGAGVSEQALSKQITCLFAVLSLAAIWAWGRRESGSPLAASVVTLVVCLCPGFFLLCLSPMSEPIALLLTVGALLAVQEESPARTRWLTVTALIALALLARAACVTLAAAWLVWLAIRRRDARIFAASAVLALAPLGAWMAHRGSIEGADSYFRSVDPRGLLERLGGWPDALFLQPMRLADGYLDMFGREQGDASVFAVVVIAGMAVCGLLVRLRSARMDAWLMVLYLALLLVWPYPTEAERFMLFALPVIVLHAIGGAQALLRQARVARMPALNAGSSLVAVLFVLASGPTVLDYIERAVQPLDAELSGDKREMIYFLAPREGAAAAAEVSARIRLAAEASAGVIPTDGCTYAIQPPLLWLHARVHAVQLPAEFTDDAPARAQLPLCDYLFLNTGAYAGTRLSGLELAERLAGEVSPVLVSSMASGDRAQVVAALLRWND